MPRVRDDDRDEREREYESERRPSRGRDRDERTSRGSRGREATDDDRPSLTCVTPVGIGRFVHVFEKHKFQGDSDDKLAYKLTIVYPKDEDLSGIERILEAAAEAKWGRKGVEDLRRGRLRTPIRDGVEYESYGEPFDEDHIFIAMHTKNAPVVRDARNEEIMDDSEMYDGIKVRASVYAHAYDAQKGGKAGVTLLLNNVQKRGDGKPLGGDGGRPDGSEFEDDERPARRRSARDDDERPARSRGRDRDEPEDEDDRPSRRRSARDEPEDEDERPRRRSARDDDEDERPRPRRRD